MTDPTTTEPAVKEEEVTSFSWWLCMLPFIVGILVCVYMWWQNRADMHWLMYAGGCLLIGIVFSAVVIGASSDDTTGGTSGSNT